MSAVLKPPESGTYYSRRQEPPGVLRELTRVANLVEAETLEGNIVPAESTGTIVGVWGAGETYDVEFGAMGLATLNVDQLRPL